jgi:hypothetical protein
MNTKENNKLLAEFLGLLTTNANGDIKEDLEAFKFHNDWNWLMLVVEKIESLGHSIIIDENWCVIKSKRTLYKKERIANTKIEAVYNACIEFVKWYNEQNN